MRKPVHILFACLLSCGLGAQSPGQSQRRHEQTAFTAEDENVRRPIPVPEDVLWLLATEEIVRDAMADSDPPAKTPPQAWFSASVIHLGSASEEDLVVEAKGPLVGANIDTFWVFLRTAKGLKLVLTAPVHDLVVKRTRHNGYRDIELLGATAVEWSTTLLRFDGQKYEAYRSKCGPDPC